MVEKLNIIIMVLNKVNSDECDTNEWEISNYMMLDTDTKHSWEMFLRFRINTGFTQKTWLHHWRPRVCLKKIEKLKLSFATHITHKP